MNILDYFKFWSASFRNIERTSINQLVVSTVYASDTGKFETAILDKTHTIPVERYEHEDASKEGHVKWVKWASACKTGDKVTQVGIKNVYSQDEPDREVEIELGFVEVNDDE